MNAPTGDPMPGCYIDSHHGHYAHVEAIKIAVSMGMPIDPFTDWVLAKYDDHWHEADYPSEALLELLDEAEDFLNQNHGLPGHWWMWNDGDFGLYAEGDVD
jgi:hypothetical protein